MYNKKGLWKPLTNMEKKEAFSRACYSAKSLQGNELGNLSTIFGPYYYYYYLYIYYNNEGDTI